MMQKLFAAGGLLSAVLTMGCAMCQDCQDDLGPVPQSENFPSFTHSPRVNSATTTAEEPEFYEGVPSDSIPAAADVFDEP